MMRWLALLLACLLAASAAAETAGAPTSRSSDDSAALKALYDADQADRTDGSIAREPEAVLCRDEKRRKAALSLLRAGALHTATDHFRAAMIFQHSHDDISLAYALTTIASHLDPSQPRYRWLAAASWDRMLVQQVQPQWYGTQFQSDEQGLFLYPVAEGAVSDAERRRMGVPDLAEARGMPDKIAAMEGKPPRTAPAPSIAQLQAKGRPGPPVVRPGACKEE